MRMWMSTDWEHPPVAVCTITVTITIINNSKTFVQNSNVKANVDFKASKQSASDVIFWSADAEKEINK